VRQEAPADLMSWSPRTDGLQRHGSNRMRKNSCAVRKANLRR